jgi:hypothetical protein
MPAADRDACFKKGKHQSTTVQCPFAELSSPIAYGLDMRFDIDQRRDLLRHDLNGALKLLFVLEGLVSVASVALVNRSLD